MGNLSWNLPQDGRAVRSLTFYSLVPTGGTTASQVIWCTSDGVCGFSPSLKRPIIILSSLQLRKSTLSWWKDSSWIKSKCWQCWKLDHYSLSLVKPLTTFNLLLIISQWDKCGSRKGGKVVLSLPVHVTCICLNLLSMIMVTVQLRAGTCFISHLLKLGHILYSLCIFNLY